MEKIRAAVLKALGLTETDLGDATLTVEHVGESAWRWDYADSMTHDLGDACETSLGTIALRLSPDSSSYEPGDDEWYAVEIEMSEYSRSQLSPEPYYCPCGCAQEVRYEGEFASDECEVSPEQFMPDAYDLDCAPNPPLSSGMTWESYLDSLR